MIEFCDKVVEYEMIARKLFLLWRRKSAMLTKGIVSAK